MPRSSLVAPCLLVACAALAGCPAVPPPESPEGPVGGPSFASARTADDAQGRPFSDEEKAQSRGKLGGVWAACYKTFEPRGDPAADLARLTAACGAPTGLAPITPVRVGETQSADDPAERFTFRARGSRCYRFFAIAAASVADLDVAVLDPEGGLAAADLSRDRWPVVPPRGPLCVDRDGVYSVEVAVAQGSGAYVLEVLGD